MTEEAAETTITRQQMQILDLKNQVAKLTLERDKAQYKQEIAEWAVVGVVTSRVQFRLMQDAGALAKMNDILAVAELMGKRAAHELLHGAQVAFDAHTDMYELRQHLYYLENHCRSCGVEFRPWVETPATQGMFEYTRYSAWPFPKAFSKERERNENP